MGSLQENLLRIMDAKHHWAYPALTRPGLQRAQLLVHFRHEYLVYVRDFPVLLARALGNVPALPAVRCALAENLYEEQTGGLSATAPHPELFLRMMTGLGFEPCLFEDRANDEGLEPEARAYRDFLRDRAGAQPWVAAVALLTIFVEGSVNERAELAGTYVRRRGEEAVREHPLVKHYGCPAEAMSLTRAHAEVEGDHRASAWRTVLDHAAEGSADARAALGVCERALTLWLSYRDGVARRMGLSERPSSAPSESRARATPTPVGDASAEDGASAG